MKITVIHGQSHKGSTYHIARMLAEKLNGDITEFFLPRDFSNFCVGCTNCFAVAESKCPHCEKLKPITEAINGADVLIFASPVYVYHATASMKVLLDHYGYQWMVHRPNETMFKKQAVCISTAAGAGMKSTNKDMYDSLFFWGVAKIYKYGVGVRAVSFDSVGEKTKANIEQKTTSLANKINSRNGKVKPGFKTRMLFNIMRIAQKRGFIKVDSTYWQEKGWTGKKRPWKQ